MALQRGAFAHQDLLRHGLTRHTSFFPSQPQKSILRSVSYRSLGAGLSVAKSTGHIKTLVDLIPRDASAKGKKRTGLLPKALALLIDWKDEDWPKSTLMRLKKAVDKKLLEHGEDVQVAAINGILADKKEWSAPLPARGEKENDRENAVERECVMATTQSGSCEPFISH